MEDDRGVDRIELDFRAIAQHTELTIYAIAKKISEETGEELKTAHQRWSRWVKENPAFLDSLKLDLDILGYEIFVQKKKGRD